MTSTFSLTPGFSPGLAGDQRTKPFQRFSGTDKPLKRLARPDPASTRLKPGVNENDYSVPVAWNFFKNPPCKNRA
jgi:hypothetical protein